MAWIPTIKDIKKLEDLEINSAYLVKFGNDIPRPMIYEGSVELIQDKELLGFMEVSQDMDKILSWRTNKDKLKIQFFLNTGIIAFIDEKKRVNYTQNSSEFQTKYPLIINSNKKTNL